LSGFFCFLVTGAGISSAVGLCGKLRELDLSHLELMTDDALVCVGKALPALEALRLRSNVQLSDVSIMSLAQSCKVSLTELSLNNVPAIGDAAVVALREHCAASLQHLDISWCRSITDHALGALVDACKELESLTLFGCTQLTSLFFNGHSRDALRIIGRSCLNGFT